MKSASLSQSVKIIALSAVITFSSAVMSQTVCANAPATTYSSAPVSAGIQELNNSAIPTAIQFKREINSITQTLVTTRYQKFQGENSYRRMIGSPTGKNYMQDMNQGPIYFQPLTLAVGPAATQWLSFNLMTTNYASSAAGNSENAHILAFLKARGSLTSLPPQLDGLGLILYKKGYFWNRPRSDFAERVSLNFGYDTYVYPGPVTVGPLPQQFELKDCVQYQISVHVSGTYVAYWITDPSVNKTFSYSVNTAASQVGATAGGNVTGTFSGAAPYGIGLLLGIAHTGADGNTAIPAFTIDFTSVATGWF